MNLIKMKHEFEKSCLDKSYPVYESSKLEFIGVDGFDVYNCSIPFSWKGERLIFGRVEKREEWARSWVRLFEEKGKDCWSVVPDSTIYTLEDPYVAVVGNELTLGGTNVRKRSGKVDNYYCDFYRGTKLNDMVYFTSGPDRMKDVRLVDLGSKIGVFSRPRGEYIRKEYGSESIIGYMEISTLDELDASVIESAPAVSGLFSRDQWGGCNQVYLLEDGMIGIIGHISYVDSGLDVYMNMSFVMNRETLQASELKIIGTRKCYPEGPCKKPYLKDCVFTGGIVMREDERVDLYSGLGDVDTGRIVIDYPFKGHGRVIGENNF